MIYLYIEKIKGNNKLEIIRTGEYITYLGMKRVHHF